MFEEDEGITWKARIRPFSSFWKAAVF